MKQETQRNHAARQAVLQKIADLERLGGEHFFADAENDPPVRPLKPEDVDYLHEAGSSKLLSFFANRMEELYQCSAKRRFGIEISGEENLRGISGGAVLTSNHFSHFENLAIKTVADRAGKKHHFYKVIREGNFTIPGLLGFLLRHCNTLPLSGNVNTMVKLDRAIARLLSDGNFILIYPEQSMWWNYRKPRPFRIGAFRYAAKNGVPVIPCFVTMRDQPVQDENGFPQQRYTVHVMPPIYPDHAKNFHDAAQEMLVQNRALCRSKYEQVYGEPPVYACGEVAD